MQEPGWGIQDRVRGGSTQSKAGFLAGVKVVRRLEDHFMVTYPGILSSCECGFLRLHSCFLLCGGTQVSSLATST